MKILAIVQARLGSSRFPRKVLADICGSPVLQIVLERLRRSNCLDQIVVAVPDGQSDDYLARFVEDLGYPVSRGSEVDVLQRYYQAALDHQGDVIVRVTADCPCIDAELVDTCVMALTDSNSDYCSNIDPPTFPDGLDVQVVKIDALKVAAERAKTVYDREHVLPYVARSDQFAKFNVTNAVNLASLRLTLDYPEDLQVIRNVFERLGGTTFTWNDVVRLNASEPFLFEPNQMFTRAKEE